MVDLLDFKMPDPKARYCGLKVDWREERLADREQMKLEEEEKPKGCLQIELFA